MRPHLPAILLNDNEGVVIGGFWGCTLCQWLHVQLLFVPESVRGKGVGSTLMTTAETEARKRGCIGAFVASFSFQATPSYEKPGYVRRSHCTGLLIVRSPTETWRGIRAASHRIADGGTATPNTAAGWVEASAIACSALAKPQATMLRTA